MTEQETQKWLERFEWDDSEETSEALATICEALQEYPKYKELGTVEELRDARDKQVGKKPVLVTRGLIKFYPCPNADCSNPNKYMQVYPNQKYCVYCGQKLNWKEV